jgi:hypothetical protein
MGERQQQGQRVRGWRQWTAERAQRELEEWRASGEPLAAFARRRGFSSQRLRWWRDRLAQWSGEGQTPPRLIPVSVAAPVAARAPAVTVHLPDGGRVEVEDVGAVPPEWLAALVRKLGRVAE